MSKLVKIILRVCLLGPWTKPIANQSQTDDGEPTPRYVRCWEEALLASMYDDNARMYLDHYETYHHGARRYGG